MSLRCLRVCAQILILLILRAGGICPRVSALWIVSGHISPDVRFLSCLWVYVPNVWGRWHACGCMLQYVRSLFMGECTGMSSLSVYLRLGGLWSVWVFVSQDERFLIWLWVYISGCEFSDPFGSVCQRCEVSALFVNIFPKVWGLWSVCHSMSQDVRSLSLGVCRGCKVSDLFLILCPWMLDFWSLFGYMCQCVSPLTCLWVCAPRYEVSELFVDIFPWLLYFWAFFGCVFWECEYSDLFVVCVTGYEDYSVWGYLFQSMKSLLCLWVWVSECEILKMFVSVVPRMYR